MRGLCIWGKSHHLRDYKFPQLFVQLLSSAWGLGHMYDVPRRVQIGGDTWSRWAGELLRGTVTET